ncbi:MAG: DUF5658 family protein, partial [Planctomycetota bacterium]
RFDDRLSIEGEGASILNPNQLPSQARGQRRCEGSEAPSPSIERRSSNRRKPQSWYQCLRWGGRRKAIRREHESAGSYVDHAQPVIATLVFFLLGASIADAVLTILHLERGAAEANPVMDAALGLGREWFIAMKLALTAIGAMYLAIHQNFLLGRRGLQFMSLFYALLLVYHALIVYFGAGMERLA